MRAKTNRERALTDDNQGGIEDGNALGRSLEVSALLGDQFDAVSDLLRRGGGVDGRCHEGDGTDNEGAEGDHV